MELEKQPDNEHRPRLAKSGQGRGKAGRRKEHLETHRSPMYYGEFEPVPELKPWVAAYWQFQVEPDVGEIEHWIPLTGGVMLAWSSGAPVIATGPRIEPFATRVRGGDLYWGVHLWPGAAPSLLGSRILGLRAVHRPVRDVLGTSWSAELEGVLQNAVEGARGESAMVEILDSALLRLVADAGSLDEAVMTAVMRLIAAGGSLSSIELANSVHLSPRQFRRRFRAVTELTPKELSRLQRMRSSAVDAVAEGPSRWVDVAARRGYADQAHLVREFRRILGLTPVAFEAHAGRIRHGRIIR